MTLASFRASKRRAGILCLLSASDIIVRDSIYLPLSAGDICLFLLVILLYRISMFCFITTSLYKGCMCIWMCQGCGAFGEGRGILWGFLRSLNIIRFTFPLKPSLTCTYTHVYKHTRICEHNHSRPPTHAQPIAPFTVNSQTYYEYVRERMSLRSAQWRRFSAKLNNVMKIQFSI